MADEAKARKSGGATETAPDEEAIYSRDDLMRNAEAFGVRPEAVAGAMHLAGKDEMSLAEAREAVETYNKREV